MPTGARQLMQPTFKNNSNHNCCALMQTRIIVLMDNDGARQRLPNKQVYEPPGASCEGCSRQASKHARINASVADNGRHQTLTAQVYNSPQLFSRLLTHARMLLMLNAYSS